MSTTLKLIGEQVTSRVPHRTKRWGMCGGKCMTVYLPWAVLVRDTANSVAAEGALLLPRTAVPCFSFHDDLVENVQRLRRQRAEDEG